MSEITEPLALDATDLRILEQLQRDASLTNQALAAAVHTSPATCLRRVKRLMDTGVIERQVALLSPAKLGAWHLLMYISFVLVAAVHPPQPREALEKA